MLSRFGIFGKFISLSAAGILIFVAAIFWVNSCIDHKIMQEKKLSLKNETDTAYSIIAAAAAEADAGKMSPAQAKALAKAEIKNLRYGKDGYFWIMNLSCRMIMHPFDSKLDGKNLSGIADSHGKHLFSAMVRVCQKSHHGYVSYLWPKPGSENPQAKISFVKLYQPWGWIVGTGVYLSDIHTEMNSLIYTLLGILLIYIIAWFLLSWFASRVVASPIHSVAEGMGGMTKLVRLKSSQIASSSQQLAEGASQQAAALEETSSAIEEVSSMVRQTAENAQVTDRQVKGAAKNIKDASAAMNDLNTRISAISDAGGQTQKIIKTIDEIAFQTNLLALNPAVEAARAGEAGAGFAVVADEVRNLALRAAEAARNSSEIIEDTVDKISDCLSLSDRVNVLFTKMDDGAQKVQSAVAEIASSCTEQAEGIEQISRAINEMDTTVQKAAAQAEESASVSEEMNSQAQHMRDFVDQLFKVIGRTSNGHVVETAVVSKQITLPPRPAQPKAATSEPASLIPLDEDDDVF